MLSRRCNYFHSSWGGEAQGAIVLRAERFVETFTRSRALAREGGSVSESVRRTRRAARRAPVERVACLAHSSVVASARRRASTSSPSVHTLAKLLYASASHFFCQAYTPSSYVRPAVWPKTFSMVLAIVAIGWLARLRQDLACLSF